MYTILFCTSGSHQGHLSVHCSQHANHVRDTSTSSMKNCALSQARSSQESWV